jgi:hypothetical protein
MSLHEPGLGSRLRDRAAEAFGFERGDEALGQRVGSPFGHPPCSPFPISPPPPRSQGLPERGLMLAETPKLRSRDPRKGGAGVLNEAVTVMDETDRWSLAGGGTVEGGEGQFGAHVLPAGMRQAAPETGIERESQIQSAFPRLDAGEVTLPDHPWSIRLGHFGQPVLGAPVIVAAVWSPALPTSLFPSASSVVRGRKRRFCLGRRPASRIRRLTRFLPQRCPTSRRLSWMRGLP